MSDVDILARLSAHRLVPVVVIDDAADAHGMGDALVAGGLPVAEITLRTPAGLAAIAALAQRGDLLVGAGTVTDADQVDAAADAGAQFIVSPGTSASVLARCRDRGVVAIPGAVTATEVMAALESGVTTVKFFPAASSGGVPALRALAAPFGDVRFVPTGGIGSMEASAYLAHAQVSAVGGSWMVPRAAVAAGQFDQIEELVRDAVAACQEEDR